MRSLEVYLKSFETYLNAHPFVGEPASLYDAANYIMKLGGKRLRPAMVLMGCDAFSGDYAKALPAAMAIEVFHNFTLVHDDIMDAAPLRRGQLTVHKKWDESTAILCGDMMMFEASGYLLELPDSMMRDALMMFNTTAIEVCNGQQMDMLFEKRSDVQIAEYLEMIALKTSVLLGCSFYLGALIGGASVADAKAIYAFGKNLGIAFQLHDDILDAFATDQASFGKQVGGDILSNKKTFLLLTAFKNADTIQQERLQFWIENTSANSNEKVEAVKEIFIATGALEAAGKAKEQYYQLALQSLEALNISTEVRAAFAVFAEMVMKRSK